MKAKRYVVCENTPGYMPESEPAEFDNWHSALDHARTLIAEMQDQGYDLVSETGLEFHYGEFILMKSPADLGRCVSINGIGY